MIDPLATSVVVLAVAFGVLGLVTALVRKPPGTVHVGAAALVEIAVLAQVVAAIVALVGGGRPAELATFLGYLVGSVLVVPVAVLWAAAERNRWASVVLGIAGLVLAVIVLRLEQVWSGG